jgi:hypothetical protein
MAKTPTNIGESGRVSLSTTDNNMYIRLFRAATVSLFLNELSHSVFSTMLFDLAQYPGKLVFSILAPGKKS